jgi:hypothetical protein
MQQPRINIIYYIQAGLWPAVVVSKEKRIEAPLSMLWPKSGIQISDWF